MTLDLNGKSLSKTTLYRSEPDLPNGIESQGRERKTDGPPPTETGTEYVNAGEEDQMEIVGYFPHRGLFILTWILIVFSLFLLRLIFHWKPAWMLVMTNVRCSLARAKKVLLVDQYKQRFVEPVIVLRASDCKSQLDVAEEAEDKGGGGTVLRDVNCHDPSTSSLVLPGPEGKLMEVSQIRYFENKKIKYIWNSEKSEFAKLKGLDAEKCSYYYQQRGLSVAERDKRIFTFGSNSIDVPVHSVLMLLFVEILTPFYVFQIFSVCLWFSDDYYYYAACIVVMSAFSITATVLQTRKNEEALRNTILSSDVINVCRGKDVYESVTTEQLVPGDVIAIPAHGCMMHCDAVLISGNCIVNESMLTGESVPVTKTPIPKPSSQRGGRDMLYHSKEHSKHTLFCGTKVIQTRYYGSERVKAVVIRTGFMTAKGELVRSIMFPKPVDFKFHQDSLKFIGLLFAIAFLGFVYTVVRMYYDGASASDIVLDALDLITIAVPPALPAAMTAGIAYAQSRLKRQGIYCISPRSINISGCIDCVCFDKTGTLTEDGLDMWGVLPAEDAKFTEVVKKVHTLPKGAFLIGMATCHSLTIIEGQLSGDPLDLKMFEATNWVLEEPEIDETAKYDIITPTVVRPRNDSPSQTVEMRQNDVVEPPLEVGIVRQFPFSSSLQRMSVITRILGAKHFEIYTKGSPEVIASLSAPHTVPENFTEVLMHYTRRGYRVLAVACRPLPKMTYARVQRIMREEVETNLTFLGLLVMENRLKAETTSIIQTVKRANIRTVMITGDNMLTALSVARDCGMIENTHRVILVNVVKSQEDKVPAVKFVYAEMPDLEVEEVEYATRDRTEVVIEQHGEKFHFAITGKAFAVIKEYFPELLPKLTVRGTVFARMSPDQKQQLIEQFQELGYYVAMCGDGANDCGALKTAHAGISLSEAEASVASPFTSKTPNISCVPTLIREGRAAMTTSFGIFKYMACYSLTQFCSVLILYSIGSNLTDFEFLYIDLFLITFFAAVFGRTAAYSELVKQPPPSSLISLTPLASLVSQMIIIIAFQVYAFVFVQQQPWFKPFVPSEDSVGCYENYAVFAVSSFQYITLVICFAKGAPYRKNIFTNRWLLGSLIVMTAVTIYVNIYPFYWLHHLLELVLPPSMLFRWLMVAFAAVNFIICMICEDYFVNILIFKMLDSKCQSLQTKAGHKRVECEIMNTPEWPPVSSDVDIGNLPMYTNSPSLASSPTNVPGVPAQTNAEGSDTEDDCEDVEDDDESRPVNKRESLLQHFTPNGPRSSLKGEINEGSDCHPENGTGDTARVPSSSEDADFHKPNEATLSGSPVLQNGSLLNEQNKVELKAIAVSSAASSESGLAKVDTKDNGPSALLSISPLTVMHSNEPNGSTGHQAPDIS